MSGVKKPDLKRRNDDKGNIASTPLSNRCIDIYTMELMAYHHTIDGQPYGRMDTRCLAYDELAAPGERSAKPTAVQCY